MSFYFVLVATVLTGIVAQSSAEASSGLRVQSREKRQVGGEEVQDPDDPKYKKLANEAWEKYRAFDGLFVRDLIVIRVTKQVVSGLLYRISYIVVRTGSDGGHDDLLCSSEVWDKGNDQKNYKTDCGELKGQNIGKRQIDGGIEIQDPSDPEYKELAEESYKKYLETDSSHIPRMAKDIIVTKASSQVVSGSMKRIDFVVTTIYNETLLCHSKVWEQPWRNKKDITVNCKVLGQ